MFTIGKWLVNKFNLILVSFLSQKLNYVTTLKKLKRSKSTKKNLVKMRCKRVDCQYDTTEDAPATANPTLRDHIDLLSLHDRQLHPPATLQQPQVVQQVAPQQNTQRVQPPKLILVDGKIEEAGWDAFAHAWANYKQAGNVQVGNEKSLLANVLGETYTKVFGRLGVAAYDAITEQSLLENAKKLVVIRRNKLVNRMKLASMQQGSDETALNFETRLKPVARTGKFKVSGVCTCTKVVELDYTDEMVLDNFVRGLVDEEIKTKVFALKEEDCTPENVLKVVEAEELGKRSVQDTKQLSDIHAVSAYKRLQRNNPTVPETPGSPSTPRWQCFNCHRDHAKKAECSAKNSTCSHCKKLGHWDTRCRKKNKEHRPPQNQEGGQNSIIAEEVGDILAIETATAGTKNTLDEALVYTLPHVKFDRKKGKYIQTPLPKPVQMLISVRFAPEQHSKLCMDTNKKDTVANKENVKTDILAVPDTGASVNCTGVNILGILGIRKRHLFQTNVILRTANRKTMTVLGVVPVEIETMSADMETRVKTHTILYVVEELKSTFISKDTLTELGCIPSYFPMPPPRRDYARVNSVRGTANKEEERRSETHCGS